MVQRLTGCGEIPLRDLGASHGLHEELHLTAGARTTTTQLSQPGWAFWSFAPFQLLKRL